MCHPPFPLFFLLLSPSLWLISVLHFPSFSFIPLHSSFLTFPSLLPLLFILLTLPFHPFFFSSVSFFLHSSSRSFISSSSPVHPSHIPFRSLFSSFIPFSLLPFFSYQPLRPPAPSLFFTFPNTTIKIRTQLPSLLSLNYDPPTYDPASLDPCGRPEGLAEALTTM